MQSFLSTSANILLLPEPVHVVLGFFRDRVIAFPALRASSFVQGLPWTPERLGVSANAHGVTRNVVVVFGFASVVFARCAPRSSRMVALTAFPSGLDLARPGMPGRVCNVLDIVASVAGIVATWTLAWLARRVPESC